MNDQSIGQRVTSALVDVVFFAVVWSLARSHVLEGQAVVGLLSAYAGARFGIAHGKQVVAVSSRVRDGGGGDGGSGPSSGSSQQVPSVRPAAAAPIPREDRPWERDRARRAVAAVDDSVPTAVVVASVGVVVGLFLGVRSALEGLGRVRGPAAVMAVLVAALIGCAP